MEFILSAFEPPSCFLGHSCDHVPRRWLHEQRTCEWVVHVSSLFECTKQNKLDMIITQQSLHKPPNQYIMQRSYPHYSHGVTNAENVL